MGMKVLLTGAGGQLGQDLSGALSAKNADVLGPTSGEMDIRNADAIRRVFEAFQPDAVVHCAAYNQVDRAEEEPEECWSVNVKGTEYLASACREYGAYLLAISTDYVFDGRKTGEYETDDRKNPLSVYGASKAKGEEIVLEADAGNAVIRTSWLFGPGSHNFVEAIRRNGAAKDCLSVVNDQVGSPTYTEDLAELIVTMTFGKIPGLYHGTNEGFCSRAAFAREIIADLHLRCGVLEIPSESLKAAAQRPKNSRLSKSNLDLAGLRRLPDWRDALERYLKRTST